MYSKIGFAILVLISINYTNLNAQNSRVGEVHTFNSKISLQPFIKSHDIVTGSELESYDKPIAFLFWLSSCRPCINEFNAIQKNKIYDEIKGKITMIVVSDDMPNNYNTARLIAQKNNWDFNMYFDKYFRLRNNLLNYWYGVPQVLIMDSNKKIVLHKFGYKKGDEVLLLKSLSSLINSD